MDLVFASDGTDHPPQGVRGGQAGGGAGQQVRRRNGALEELDKVTQIMLEEGEITIGLTCGGGGYGNPKMRDPECVRHDVAEGWLSRARARETYGVAIGADGTVDETATRVARQGRLIGAQGKGRGQSWHYRSPERGPFSRQARAGSG